MSGGTLHEHEHGHLTPETATVLRMVLSMQLDMISAIDPSNPAAEPDEERSDQQRYAERNIGVVMAIGTALGLGYPAGFRVDPELTTDAEEWIVAYIELPTGQVLWHLPAFVEAWDLHSTTDKYARIAAFAALSGVAATS